MMAEPFKTIIRKVGSSFGVLIPSQIIKENKLDEGKEIEIVILQKNKKFLDESFGIDKRKIKFKFIRDKTDRLERYAAS